MSNAYQIAANAKQQIKKYEAVYNEVAPTIEGYLKKASKNTVLNEYGRFQLIPRIEYQYSAQVINLMAKLRELQAREVNEGIAKQVITKKYLRYSMGK